MLNRVFLQHAMDAKDTGTLDDDLEQEQMLEFGELPKRMRSDYIMTEQEKQCRRVLVHSWVAFNQVKKQSEDRAALLGKTAHERKQLKKGRKFCKRSIKSGAEAPPPPPSAPRKNIKKWRRRRVLSKANEFKVSGTTSKAPPPPAPPPPAPPPMEAAPKPMPKPVLRKRPRDSSPKRDVAGRVVADVAASRKVVADVAVAGASPKSVAASRKVVADVAAGSSQKSKCRVVAASSSPKPVAGASAAASSQSLSCTMPDSEDDYDAWGTWGVDASRLL